MKGQNKKLDSSRRSSFRRRPWLIILILLLAAGLCLLIAKLLADQSHVPSEPQNTTESNQSSISNSTEVATNTTTKKDPIPQYEGDDPNSSESLTGSLTTAHVSGEKFLIRVNIDQYLSSGSCTLEMSDGDNRHTDSAQIIPSASTSTCEGFDVPLRALGSGKYSINITIESEGKTGHISGEVSI